MYFCKIKHFRYMLNVNFIKRYVPRWAIFTFDVLVTIFSLILAYFLRFNFKIPHEYYATFFYTVPIVGAVRIISFYISRTYAGIIRYTSTRDALRIFADDK